jgi:SecD/SecF fusion protein
MLIGIITGTYSSIFVAAPLIIDLGKKKALVEDIADEGKKKGTPKPATAK